MKDEYMAIAWVLGIWMLAGALVAWGFSRFKRATRDDYDWDD